MKNLIHYITEASEAEDLQEEVGIALHDFGSTRNGFKTVNKQAIVDAMYQLGFDLDEETSDTEKLVFVGDYIDNQYEVDLYIAHQTGDKIKLRNYKAYEI